MKEPRVQGSYTDSRTNAHRTSLGRKAEASLYIKPDNQQTIQSNALDRLLKDHSKHCTFWIFSGDRHCSCGRNVALAELESLKTLAASGASKKV